MKRRFAILLALIVGLTAGILPAACCVPTVDSGRECPHHRPAMPRLHCESTVPDSEPSIAPAHECQDPALMPVAGLGSGVSLRDTRASVTWIPALAVPVAGPVSSREDALAKSSIRVSPGRLHLRIGVLLI